MFSEQVISGFSRARVKPKYGIQQSSNDKMLSLESSCFQDY